VRAITLFTSTVNRCLGASFTEACKRNGIELTLHTARENYKQTFNANYNILSWGVKMPKWWYDRKGKNVCFLENGLFCQKEGIWIDAGGWFADSNLSRERHFRVKQSAKAWHRVRQIAKRFFGWEFWQGGKPDGPIMFAVQRNRDAPCQFHFPRQNKHLGALESSIKLLSEHCPDRPVAIRPHPRFVREWKANEPNLEKYFRPDWTIDYSPRVYATLRECSALVTVNSTLATEALFLGMPVATLGNSAFTGSNVTLECGADPARLAGLFDFEPQQEPIKRYLGACMRHQLQYNLDTDGILENREFQRWLERVEDR